jgi:hypothetical protein
MTWGENLQRDIVDAFQATSGTESTRAKDLDGVPEGRRAAVVEMVAGGWSFAARDQEGGVYVWGMSLYFSPSSYLSYSFSYCSHQRRSLTQRSIGRGQIRIRSTRMAR